MTKKYLSKHTRSRHTYAFFRDRQSDPKWRDEFLEVRSMRRRSLAVKGVVTIILCATIFLFWKYTNTVQNQSANNHQTATSKSRPNTQHYTNKKPQKPTATSKSRPNTQHYTNKKSQKSTVTKASNSTASTISSQPHPSKVKSRKKSLSNRTIAQQLLQNKGYKIEPVLYDDEPIDQAMANDKAPQNAVHDNMSFVYFKNPSLIQRTLLGAYNPSFQEHYSLSNTELIITPNHIPYHIENHRMIFTTWNIKSDGHTTTFKFKEYPDAKQMIDSKPKS